MSTFQSSLPIGDEPQSQCLCWKLSGNYCAYFLGMFCRPQGIGSALFAIEAGFLLCKYEIFVQVQWTHDLVSQSSTKSGGMVRTETGSDERHSTGYKVEKQKNTFHYDYGNRPWSNHQTVPLVSLRFCSRRTHAVMLLF
jgi:hypothetical protein